jgi:8-oxo-dGTP pyrophosphatase MutT (NUDIX family)
MIREFSAGIVVYVQKRERKYLLLHYQSGHWDFPKGHIEKGEKAEEAALRELQEETGLSAEIHEEFKESITYFHHLMPTKDLAHKTVYFFVGKANFSAVILSHEHIDFAWLSFDEAYKKLTYDNAREILEKADQFLKSKK